MRAKHLLILMMISVGSYAQQYEKSSSGITTAVAGNEVKIQFYSPSIVRVVKSPINKPFSKTSLSVIATPIKTVFTASSGSGFIIVKSDKLSVRLNTKTGEIRYQTIAGEVLLSEKPNSASFTPFDDAGNKTFSISQSFQLAKDEPIYGLGQHQRGNLSQRNQKYSMMMQSNTDDPITFFQSVKGYGVFWDNYSPTTFEDNATETYFKSEVGDCIDYYFIYGGIADGVIAGMRELTGQAPMFPLWTYGFWQSRERYKSQLEIVDVVKKYRELKVPLDGIIQDWQYWGDNYHWNGMGFLNPEFPQPEKMVADIHAMNAHAIISIWASFGPKTKPYEELNAGGMLFNFSTWPESAKDVWPPDMNYPSGVRVYDAYNPAARDIYWRYLNKGLFSLGLDGWWMDSSEPDHLSFKDTDLDQQSFLGSFRKVRNAFPLMTVGGVYDHQRKENVEKRIFILTRSAFAGQQRYGANTWSGDITSSWETLKNQIPTGLNFSLSGIPYWNSDIGGFFLGSFHKKLEDPEYRELYARWVAFGTFCPMMRSHGTDAPREIYQFGSKGTRVYDAIEKFIHLRYSLLPYIYSTSWDVTANQSSMMRALVMDFVKDHNAWNVNNEFMFGKSILVTPVTQAQYLKQVVNGNDTAWAEDFSANKSTSVYLPAGTSWFDFWTGEQVAGGKTLLKETPLDIIPLYVKAGAILPLGPQVQYAEEKKWDNLEIRVYPGSDGRFVLYEDENDNYNYEKGIYSTITFKWDNKAKTLTIGERKGKFPGMVVSRKFTVVLAGTSQAGHPGKIVDYNGNAVNVKL
ncbi:glycoside hydrolase family 31 protein [Chitinophaga sancti]|uniref:Alpha-D-xyloside xylohydrolase n=1 Tax=Chitinophaga sancti TaxID=1004 RepID=A0A1K1SM96_9BACT|nr:TIM-barrel domain-containing protein [Chitinophaga sancti]WQD63927.1 glycoside hydrolase family 31 protein [Chitinophaga sancti]WQG90448.1 glycoside hydrolase family 31 protein [Chitinophaga sancti]SFW85451.1 alpha-D-xyloside xylohydrolase [Chitinophaga sancti]